MFAELTDPQKASRCRYSGSRVHRLLTNKQRSNAKPEASTTKNEGFMAILAAVLEFLFGCHHAHLSRVFTLKGETYKVCCDCGAKFAYSLETMSIERRLQLTPVLTQFRIA